MTESRNKEDGCSRKFICVQLPDKTEESSEVHKPGYKSIAELAIERIHRVIKQIEKKQEAVKNEKASQFKLKKQGEPRNLILASKSSSSESPTSKYGKAGSIKVDKK